MDQAGRAVMAAAVLALGLVVVGQTGAAEQSTEPPPPAKIVNGTPTSMQPTTGALLFVGPDTKNQFLDCSGVLIGCRTFLTAAHCICTQSSTYSACKRNELAALDPADLRVFLQHAGIFHVREVYISPDYSRGSRGDVAMLRLSELVTGIEPSRINDSHGSVPYGKGGIIAGFGNSDHRHDAAIKRVGKVNIAACTTGIPEPANLCWNFRKPIASVGEDSNVCFMDDGGPLFIDFGSGPELAGIHSGGGSTCDANTYAYDSSVYAAREWIRSVGGPDVDRDRCSDLGAVGERWVDVTGDAGTLPRGAEERRFNFIIPEDTQLQRVIVNGDTTKTGDYDFYVKMDGKPTRTDYDCAARGTGQFGVCELENPDASTLQVLIRHVMPQLELGRSRFQITVTSFLPVPPESLLPKRPIHLRYEVVSDRDRRLTWKDLSRDEDGFELQRRTGEGTRPFETRVVVRPDVISYVDAARSPNIFTYRVRAFNEHGFSRWSNLCVVNRPAPLAPSRLTAVEVTAHRVSLTWKDRSDDERGFHVQRRAVGEAAWRKVAALRANQTQYLDKGLVSGRTYEYRVRARGGTARCVPNSDYSSSIRVTTP